MKLTFWYMLLFAAVVKLSYANNVITFKREMKNVGSEVEDIEELLGNHDNYGSNSIYAGNKNHNQDADLNVTELLKKYGYPAETHKVVTKDGYILILHRIPHGRNESRLGDEVNKEKEESKPVVFLQHGLLCSSADWLMNSHNAALGYQLADKGYDVWLGNARGNTYSKAHVSLSPSDSKFWDFTFHQMGYYDIPAVLDYILNTTNQKKLSYIGHSMGTTMFWVAMSSHPEYNDKIKAMFAFGPVAFVNGSRSPIRVFSHLAMDFEKATALFGEREFLPHSSVISFFQRIFCEEKYVMEVVCENVMFLICGFDSGQLNETLLPIIMGHTPAGSSTRNIIHYLQMMRSSKFQQYDYGKWENMKIYGNEVPPSYNLSLVTAPVNLFWGENDWLAVKQNVLELERSLPNVKTNYRINLDKFNHLDFLYAIDVNKLFYNDVISLLEKSQ